MRKIKQVALRVVGWDLYHLREGEKKIRYFYIALTVCGIKLLS
jgi:hypothetical protein